MLESDALRRTALILVLAGLLWNLVEAGVSLWVGVQTGSVAMLAFGLGQHSRASRRWGLGVAVEGRARTS